MHELSLAEEIIRLITESVAPADPATVCEVRVAVGRMAGVVTDSLRFCFETLIRCTPFPRAELVIIDIPLKVVCRACQQTIQSERDDFMCPRCKVNDTEVVSGLDLQLQSIKLTDQE
jgi:hydrogenase nickel incorporation protein HypA/HybF